MVRHAWKSQWASNEIPRYSIILHKVLGMSAGAYTIFIHESIHISQNQYIKHALDKNIAFRCISSSEFGSTSACPIGLLHWSRYCFHYTATIADIRMQTMPINIQCALGMADPLAPTEACKVVFLAPASTIMSADITLRKQNSHAKVAMNPK